MASEFTVFAVAVMYKVWALRNRIRLREGEVNLAWLCVSMEATVTTQRKLLKMRWRQLDGLKGTGRV